MAKRITASDRRRKRLAKALLADVTALVKQSPPKTRLQVFEETLFLLTIMELKFYCGAMGARLEERVRCLSVEQLEKLGEVSCYFHSPQSLSAWLEDHQV